MLEEVESAILACQDADLVVFNLFTCEGYYIARSMNVPCVAASPFIITRCVGIYVHVTSLIPRIFYLTEEKKSLVTTVCACAKF